MLQLIAHIIIITVFCFIWGIPALLVLNKTKKENDIWTRNSPGGFTFLFFAGIISLSVVTSWILLWLPLNFTVLLLSTAAFLVILILFKRNEIKIALKTHCKIPSFSWLEFSFIIILILLFVVLGSIETVNSDTAIYHLQVILWTNEYGTVPGLANLFPRYGLGSNWFNLISVFRIPIFNHENYTYLNTTLAIWFFLWLFNNWSWHIKKFTSGHSSKILSLFYLLIILFCLYEWELFRDAANSASYDFIVTALTIIIISWLIESITNKETTLPPALLFIILCFSVIPFKLSGILILLFLLFFLFINKKLTTWFLSVFIALIVLLPFLLKNYIITGFPLYPLTYSISTPDWQVPVAMTDYIRNYIYVFNRFYNTPDIDTTSIPELVHAGWFNSWFRGILIQHKIIFIASFSSLSLLFFKNKNSFDPKKLRIVFMLLFLMAAGWFFTAPSPRFGYGALLFLAFFPLCYFAGTLFTPLIQRIIVVVIIAGSAFYIYKKMNPFVENSNQFLYPVASKKSDFKIIPVNGVDFYLPDKKINEWMRRCNATQLPCISQENIFLEPRGKSPKDGFRMKPITDSNFIRNYIY